MHRILVLAVTAILATSAPACADEKANELKKAVQLGDLDDCFVLRAAKRSFDPERGGTLVLTLEARKEVDTAKCFYKAGFFDKQGRVHLASPVRFAADFPLQRGESIRVEIWEGRTPRDWHKIALRKVDKPAPQGESHQR